MTGHFQRAKKTVVYRILSAFVAFTFSFNYVMPPGYAQGVPATVMNSPVPGTPVSLTPGFTPTRIIGMTIHADNPLMFDFMVDPGDMKLNDQEMQDESLKLVKYFLASLTIPAEKLWVNLSPYEKDKIVPQEFGQTEMGAELLAQDYMLKQLTASLMNPEDELGKGGNHSLVIIPPIKIFNIFVHKYGHFLGGGGEVDDSPRLAEDCPGLTTPITR